MTTARTISGYGWHPDLPDHRDLAFAAPAGPVLSRVDLSRRCPPVYDQGQLGSCTANAIAACLEFDQTLQGETPTTPSRLFIYYGERAIEGSTNYDSGAMLRDGMKVVATLGAPPETSWPYDIDQFATRPPEAAYEQARSHVAIQYLRLRAVQLREALTAGFPVAFGITVYESFEDATVAQTGVVPLPAPDEADIGGHAMTLVGYDDTTQRFLARNSWGPDWGENGYCWIPYSYLLNPTLASDMWTIRRVS